MKIYNIENKGFVKKNYHGGDFGCTDEIFVVILQSQIKKKLP
jgi:hypothetical protein